MLNATAGDVLFDKQRCHAYYVPVVVDQVERVMNASAGVAIVEGGCLHINFQT